MAEQVSSPKPDTAETTAKAADASSDKVSGTDEGTVDVRPHDQNVIELAIERALNDVRAEIEATSAEVAKAESDRQEDAAAPDAGGAEAANADAAREQDGLSAPATTATETAASDGSDPQPSPAVASTVPIGQIAEDSVKDSVRPEAVAVDAPPIEGSVPAAALAGQPAAEIPIQQSPSPEPRPPIQPLTHMLARVTPPAAMEKLDEALASAGAPPVDKAVEDAVRPIVREWLANNLPSMVERIIREEIERVSRSGV